MMNYKELYEEQLERANHFEEVYDMVICDPYKDFDSHVYASVLREIAFYLGVGGYNVDDPINPESFRLKIIDGINYMIDKTEDVTKQRLLNSGQRVHATYYDGLIFGEIANNEDCNATLIIDGDKKLL